MAAFEWKFGGLYKCDAQVAGEICEELQNSPQGLSPATLLEASKDESSPLHDDFEWRDDVAAHKYRLEQAQGIIRNIRVVVEQQDGSEARERGFVVTPGGKGAYVTLQSALNNDEWRNHLLAQAKEDATVFLAKYRRLSELAGANAELERFLHSA